MIQLPDGTVEDHQCGVDGSFEDKSPPLLKAG